MHHNGLLPDFEIENLIHNRELSSDIDIPDTHIQPASLDLRLGKIAYRLPASILPGKKVKVTDMINKFATHAMSLENGAVLEKNCVYLIPLCERLALPENISAIANAKSTTGRLDILTRLITDEGESFDYVPLGYQGALYAEVSPRSFAVLVRPYMRLNQIRFSMGRARLNDQELIELHEKEPLVDLKPYVADGLGFSVDLSAALGSVVGYKAKPHTAPIDLDLIDNYSIEDYWDEVHAKDERIILDPGAFYILASRESMCVPVDYAAEMAPFMAMVGEFRVHYAGFFDPGFGVENLGGKGARGVLEVRCHEAPFMLNHGQRMGRLLYERLRAKPKRLYGADLKSNYQGQSLKLAKQFKASK